MSAVHSLRYEALDKFSERASYHHELTNKLSPPE